MIGVRGRSAGAPSARRGAVAVMLAVGLGAAVPAVALAGTIGSRISFAGIGGLNVHSSFAHVEHVLGRPTRILRAHGKPSILFYEKQGLIFSILGSASARDYGLQAVSPRYRLADGLHIGSSEATARRDLKGGTCDRRGCSVTEPRDPARSIDVIWKRHRVVGIAVYLLSGH